MLVVWFRLVLLPKEKSTEQHQHYIAATRITEGFPGIPEDTANVKHRQFGRIPGRCTTYIQDMGLGGKPAFVDLARIGLVMRQCEFVFRGLLRRIPEHMHMLPVPGANTKDSVTMRRMLIVPVPWAYTHGTGTVCKGSLYRYHGHMLMVPVPWA